MKSLSRYRVFIISALLWLAIDLVTKTIVFKTDCCQIVFIQNIFYLTLQKNSGIAFGLPLPFGLQIISAAGIIAMLVYMGVRHLFNESKYSFINQLLLGIIIGGALGNLLNRIYLGYVIDFIALRPWPVFNLADVGITIGLILLFFLSLKTSRQNKAGKN